MTSPWLRRILLRLLEPDGPLLRAASKVDGELQLKFVFPSERLPMRTQLLLRSYEGSQALSMLPTYAGKLSMVNAPTGYELHTTVLGYYFLWFTYYVVKGTGSQVAPASWGSPGAQRHHQWPGMGSPFQGFRTPDVLHIKTATGRRHPYLELLIMYMTVYVPSPEKVAPVLSARMAASSAAAASVIDTNETFGAHGMRDRSSIGSPVTPGKMQKMYSFASFGDSAHTFVEYNGVRGAETLLLSTVVDAWLSDFSAVDGGMLESPGQGMRQSAASAMKRAYQLPYQPPPEDLLASLRLLLKYLIDPRDEIGAGCGYYKTVTQASASNPTLRSPQKTGNGMPQKRTAAEIKESVCVIRKPLYFMLRTAFQQWPNESTSRMSPMVDVMMAYIAPWVVRGSKLPIQQKDTIAGHLSAVVGRAAGSGALKQGELDERWLAHISDNIPFYSILLDGFLNLQYRRASLFPDSVARQLARVLGHLAGYPQLIKTVSEAETAYNSALGDASSPRAGQSAAQRVVAQLNELEGSSIHHGSLTLFSEGMHGGAGGAAAILQSLQSASATGKLEKRRLNDAQDSCARFFGHRMRPTFGEVPTHMDTDRPGNTPSPRHESPMDAAVNGGGDGGLTRSPMNENGEGALGSALRQRRGSPCGGHPEEADVGIAQGRGEASGILPKSSWRDVKYKGDWMHRPFGQDEIPLLSKFFVRVSDRINGVPLLREKGWRVNLRPLGEKQSLVLFLAVFIFMFLVRVICVSMQTTSGPSHSHLNSRRNYGGY